MSTPAILSARLRVAVAAAIAGLTALALLASIASAESWRSEQPPPPPAPEGEPEVGLPVPLGHVGEISFWSPDHGVLITAGTEIIPAGLYYYNGVSWRELSTVCGGSDGRIAWAGENDFWTISNQRTGQQFVSGSESALQDRSLCHFEVGASGKLEVVASYAEPIGVSSSYQQMDAAACSEPDNCWFGGASLESGPNGGGAFHLHWNGSVLTPVPSLETPEPRLQDPPYRVTGIVFYRGHFYESVWLQPYNPAEPFFFYKLVEGSSNPFVPMLAEGLPRESDPAGEREPFTYNAAGGFRFSGDSNGLWAISQGQPTLLRLGTNGQFQQVPLNGAQFGEVTSIAAEPGTDDAWVSLGGPPADPARLARIGPNGAVEAERQLPETSEKAAAKGSAGALACPAQGDCWVATSAGWLFHLGTSLPEDPDSAFRNLITYRPSDASIPFAAPEESFPEDDSGGQVAPVLPTDVEEPSSPAAPRPHEPLFSDAHPRLIDGTTLALTFTLATKSHVRLLALRRRRTVAATRSTVLARGRHTLRLHLSREAWPTRLALQVTAIGAVPLAGSGSGETAGGPTVITTSLRDPAKLRPETPFGRLTPSLR